MSMESQSDVVAFLSSPNAFGGAIPLRIDTHLSHIFLAGDRAFKMKRAVRFDFADFSSVELRRRGCEKEVEINRRTAPQLYLGTLPLYRSGDAIGWTGAGDPVEWLVEMKRFDSDQQLDVLAERGALDPDAIARLADRIAASHLNASRPPPVEWDGRSEDVIDQLSAGLLKSAIGAARKEDIVKWTIAARLERRRTRNLLALRARHGWVRRCHGDLHLANVCMLDGEPTPFDAIEFNDALATIDVLYDLAFLLMDLHRFGRADLASLALSRYLSMTRDYAGAGLLKLFQSMRAAVRAMVLSLPGRPESDLARAHTYLDVALSFLAPTEAARLIAIGGYSGTGKSTIAALLSPKVDYPHGAVWIQSDVVRKRLQGVTPQTRLGDEAYTADRTETVYRRMFKDARRASRAGRTVILDATFLDRKSRQAARATAERLGIAFHGIWLIADAAILRERIANRAGGPSDATAAVVERQIRVGDPPNDWAPVSAAGRPEESVSEIMRSLNRDETRV